MTVSADPVVIAGAMRTPIGKFQGCFANVTASQLGSVAIAGAVERSGVPIEDIDEAILGCVLSAGLGQAPARQAALGAGLPLSLPCTTVNKVCGSAMKAAMIANDLILAGSAKIVVAGGMESMSNAPYLLSKARAGYRLGHAAVVDHMFKDGLESPFDNQLMGHFAEQCADKYGFTREQQDSFAVESVRRAQSASLGKHFEPEMAVVSVSDKGHTVEVRRDETALQCDVAKIPTLKPAFRTHGSVTAANSSSISDGAAALVLMRRSEAERRGTPPLATIVGHATFAREPEWFTTAPIGAIDKLLKVIGWTPDNVDLFEINEAFAVVTMAAMRDLKLPHEKVNVNGGACALGHPIGATGARIIVTLIHALRQRGLQRGVACLCIGGGEATAVALEAM